MVRFQLFFIVRQNENDLDLPAAISKAEVYETFDRFKKMIGLREQTRRLEL